MTNEHKTCCGAMEAAAKIADGIAQMLKDGYEPCGAAGASEVAEALRAAATPCACHGMRKALDDIKRIVAPQIANHYPETSHALVLRIDTTLSASQVSVCTLSEGK